MTSASEAEVTPTDVVLDVLGVLDAFDRGERADPVSVNTLSFLKLLRETELGGDLSYASPEQVRGEVLDERSLVFSVGVLLFERLTGKHPFGAEGNHPRRVARISKGELGSGVNYFPTVPAGLRSVLVRAMGPFREERWATLRELRARLEQFVADSETARPLPGTESTEEPTVVLRHATSFGRELTSTVERHETETEGRRRQAQPPAVPTRRRRRTTTGSTAVRAARMAVDESTESSTVDSDASEQVRPDTDSWRKHLALRSKTALTPSAKPDDSDRLSSAGAIVGRTVWLAAGVVLATTVFYGYGLFHDSSNSRTAINNDNNTQDQAHRSSRGAATPVTPPAASKAPPAASKAPPAASEAPPASPPNAVEKPAQPGPAAATFSAQLGAARVAQAARECFYPKRAVIGFTFRVGVLFARSGGARKLYFSKSAGMTPRERACLREKLHGRVAGAPPAVGTVVNFRVALSRGKVAATVVP